MIKCHRCGLENPNNATFCMHCGALITHDNQINDLAQSNFQPEKSKKNTNTSIIVFALFSIIAFGILGILITQLINYSQIPNFEYPTEENTTQQVNKSKLQSKYEEALKISKDKYSDFSVQALQIQIDAAKRIIESPYATEKDVNETLQNLANAINNLKPKNDDSQKDIVIPAYKIIQMDDVSTVAYRRLSIVIETEDNINLEKIRYCIKDVALKNNQNQDVIWIYASTSKQNTIMKNYITHAVWAKNSKDGATMAIIAGGRYLYDLYWFDNKNFAADEELYNTLFGEDEQILEVGIESFNKLCEIYNNLLTSVNTKTNQNFIIDAKSYQAETLELWNILGDTYYSLNEDINDFIDNSRKASYDLYEITNLSASTQDIYYVKQKLKSCQQFLQLAKEAYEKTK